MNVGEMFIPHPSSLMSRASGTRSAAHRGVVMAVAFLIGRIIVGLYFISSGIRHFTHLKMMAGYAGSKGVPMPEVGVPASGLLILIGGLSILLGAWPTYGAIAILVFLLPTTFMMHNFWAVQDPMQKMNDMI